MMDEYESLYRSAKEAATSGRHLDAAQLYRKVAVEVPPDKQAVFYLLASEAHDDAGETEEAMADCKSAIASDPNSAQAWRALGRQLMEAGQESEAKQALCASLDLFPSASTHIYLSQICIKTGNLIDAEDHCRKALSLSPEFDEAYYNLGLVLKFQGRTNEALDAFHSSVRISPDYAIAFREIGGIQLEQGYHIDAKQHLKKCLSILPHDEKALEFLDKLP